MVHKRWLYLVVDISSFVCVATASDRAADKRRMISLKPVESRDSGCALSTAQIRHMLRVVTRYHADRRTVVQTMHIEYCITCCICTRTHSQVKCLNGSEQAANASDDR